jgi:hypothetical protein
LFILKTLEFEKVFHALLCMKSINTLYSTLIWSWYICYLYSDITTWGQVHYRCTWIRLTEGRKMRFYSQKYLYEKLKMIKKKGIHNALSFWCSSAYILTFIFPSKHSKCCNLDTIQTGKRRRSKNKLPVLIRYTTGHGMQVMQEIIWQSIASVIKVKHKLKK